MLASFDIFSPYTYTYTVSRLVKDYSGVDITVSNQSAYTYIWTVNISSYRPNSITAQNNLFIFAGSNLSNTVNTTATQILPVYSLVQAHSPPISGTFTLTINGTPITYWNSTLNANSPDLQYNIYASYLQYYIQTCLGINTILVDNPNGNYL
jgi:hypothetical protein